jgi:hypothetical protein
MNGSLDDFQGEKPMHGALFKINSHAPLHVHEVAKKPEQLRIPEMEMPTKAGSQTISKEIRTGQSRCIQREERQQSTKNPSGHSELK